MNNLLKIIISFSLFLFGTLPNLEANNNNNNMEEIKKKKKKSKKIKGKAGKGKKGVSLKAGFKKLRRGGKA